VYDFKMATVVKKGLDESEDRLIARFRKKVQAEQLLTELRKREFYQKPSTEKKERLKALQRENRRRRRRG